MLENLIRMVLQTVYNFISFILQLLSLLPICIVILCTAKMKFFMCSKGGGCPPRNELGICNCLMCLVALTILFYIFRVTGVLDNIFKKLGYVKASTNSTNSTNVTKFYDDDDFGDDRDADTTIQIRTEVSQQRVTDRVFKLSTSDTDYHDDYSGKGTTHVQGTTRVFHIRTLKNNNYDQYALYSKIVFLDTSTLVLLVDETNYSDTNTDYEIINNDGEDNSKKTSAVIIRLLDKLGKYVVDVNYVGSSDELHAIEERNTRRLMFAKVLEKGGSKLLGNENFSNDTSTVLYYLVD